MEPVFGAWWAVRPKNTDMVLSSPDFVSGIAVSQNVVIQKHLESVSKVKNTSHKPTAADLWVQQSAERHERQEEADSSQHAAAGPYFCSHSLQITTSLQWTWCPDVPAAALSVGWAVTTHLHARPGPRLQTHGCQTKPRPSASQFVVHFQVWGRLERLLAVALKDYNSHERARGGSCATANHSAPRFFTR